MTKEEKLDVVEWTALCGWLVTTCLAVAFLFCRIYLAVNGEPWTLARNLFIASVALSIFFIILIIVEYFIFRRKK